jgi:flagellar hook-associated protein 1 FlgK
MVSEGRIAGIIRARDQYMVEQVQRLDQLAGGLIYEVNRIHSTGVGLVGYTEMQSNYAALDPAQPLNSSQAGLPFPLQNGTFIVKVRDTGSGQIITRQVEVDLDGLNGDDTTLNTLAADLDGVPGINARVLADNRLEVTAEGGREFWFTEDTSGGLAALGLGAFFSGTTAADIDIDPDIRSDVRLIASSASGELLDGSIAGAIAGLASPERTSRLLQNQSIQDFHASSMERLAVQTASAVSEAESADSIHQALVAQRESISGVSLDEEAINLAQYERAYQGATRYLTVLDNLTTELLALLT